MPYECYIFSKSLNKSPIRLWNNKQLGLKYQLEFENKDEIKLKKF